MKQALSKGPNQQSERPAWNPPAAQHIPHMIPCNANDSAQRVLHAADVKPAASKTDGKRTLAKMTCKQERTSCSLYDLMAGAAGAVNGCQIEGREACPEIACNTEQKHAWLTKNSLKISKGYKRSITSQNPQRKPSHCQHQYIHNWRAHKGQREVQAGWHLWLMVGIVG